MAGRRKNVRLGPRTGTKLAVLVRGICASVRICSHRCLMATYAFDASLFEGDKIDGRYFGVPGVTVGDRLGSVNWSPDSEFLETVLKRLRKITFPGDRGAAQAFPDLSGPDLLARELPLPG